MKSFLWVVIGTLIGIGIAGQIFRSAYINPCEEKNNTQCKITAVPDISPKSIGGDAR